MDIFVLILILMGYVSLEEMEAEAGNDIWGWTDLDNGGDGRSMQLWDSITEQHLLIFLIQQNLFILGKLPTATEDSSWRDMKVYNNHVFIVSEATEHGLQIFNLSKLRGVESQQVFSADYIDNSFGQAHNIAINEDIGYAYIAGSCYDLM